MFNIINQIQLMISVEAEIFTKEYGVTTVD